MLAVTFHTSALTRFLTTQDLALPCDRAVSTTYELSHSEKLLEAGSKTSIEQQWQWNQGAECDSMHGAGGQAEGGLQGGDADGAPPCADLPFNIFAALSRDGYVRHTALTGDQPEFR